MFSQAAKTFSHLPQQPLGMTRSQCDTCVCVRVTGAGAILSSGLMKLASFETVKAFVDTAMQSDPSKTVMSGGETPCMQTCPDQDPCAGSV